MVKSATQNGNPPVATLLSYGGLAVPLAIVDVPMVIYLPVFFSREIGLDIGLVGLIFVVARIWDGITDPLIGWLSDKTLLKSGRRKPWVLIATPLLMVSIWFTFNPPPGVGAVYVTFWLFSLFLCWTAVYIPYISWGAELSTDYDGRNVVVGYREAGTMIGNIVVAAGPVLLLAADAPIRQVLLYIMVAAFVLFPLTLAPLGLTVPDRPCSQASKLSMMKALRLLGGNKPFQRFVIVVTLAGLGIGVLNSLAIFLVDDGLGLPDRFFTLYLIEYLCAIALVPFVVRAAGRFGKHRTMSGGMVAFVLALAMFAFGPRMNFPFAAVSIGILGVGILTIFMMSTSVLADIVDYDTMSSGEKRAGLFMAVYKFAAKFSMALGVGIAFGVLDLLGYDAQGSNGDSGVFVIKLVGLGVPALVLLPGIFLIARFPIDKQQHRLIRQKVEDMEDEQA
ncbi:MAG: MFS transporter [Gammaproteobacteria bacterium]|nr:MFS transporter [Gammaproteobacteria bacterium]